jgi:sulfotransferase family protein
MAGRIRESTYELLLDALTAYVRRRYRDDFTRIERFCLFVGYPRSGHSIVGAMVNAHRDAVISHELNVSPLILDGCTREELYARIVARARWFNMRGNMANYPYGIPNQWQGRCAALRVIGDKRGGTVAQAIAEHPDLLDRVQSLVGDPLRLIHVVRNPFDNIAAISIWHALSLEESVEFYFSHCETTSRLDDLRDPTRAITLRHEEMIRDPRAALTELCSFLGLELYPGYLDDCCSVVFATPSYTRRKVAWPPGLVREVERRARAFPFLDGYEFELAGGREA